MMGLLSFVHWLWSSDTTPLPSTKRLHYPKAPIFPSSVTFTLPTKVYGWLEAMAVEHNYGSVHKSIRDILLWASAACDEDKRWLFGTEHQIPACLQSEICEEATVFAGSRCDRGNQVVMVDARLSDALNRWIADCVDKFALAGPSVVLDTLCRCAIEQQAADDIFGDHETGQYYPRTTADLYHDLGIIRAPRSVLDVRSVCA